MSEPGQLPLPQIPVPLGMFATQEVKTQSGETVVMLTMTNLAGSVVQGFVDGNTAQDIARQIDKSGKKASSTSGLAAAKAKLVVPGNPTGVAS